MSEISTPLPEAPSSQSQDLEIRIDTTLGEKLLDTLQFPLHLNISENGESDLSLEPEADMEGEELEALVEDVVTPPLMTPPEQEASTNAAPDNEKRFQVRLKSAEVDVTSPPQIRLGNPITIVDLVLRFRAEVQVGVRLWGKWHWRDESTPWLNLEGRRAIVRLKAQEAQLLAEPELEDSRVILPLKIWKWPLRCHFNLSQLINRQLRRMGPFKIVDFSDFNQGRQFFGKTAQFHIQPLAESDGELTVKAAVEWC